MGRWQQELTESIEGMKEDLSETPAKVSASILQYSCLENPMDRGAWQVTVYGVPRVGHDSATKTPPQASCTVSCFHTMLLPLPSTMEKRSHNFSLQQN